MSSILFLSHTLRTGTFKVGSHHLSRELAHAGHRVAHVSTPFSAAHRILHPDQQERIRAAAAGVQIVDGVMDMVPRSVMPANVTWTKAQMRRVQKHLGMPAPDFVFIDQPLFPARHFPDSTVVFRPTDVFADPRMHQRAQQVLRDSHGIAATSPGTLRSLVAGYAGPQCVIENGVEFSRFSGARTEDKDYDFVYVGALDQRFDFEALAHAAHLLPNAVFAVFGPIPAGMPTDHPANIQFRGPVPYEQVPEVLGAGRVGIMPFKPMELNSARSPMKLYEYIAAGLPVLAPRSITERVPELDSLISYGEEGFAAAASAMLSSATEVSADDRSCAAQRDWSAIAGELLEFARACSPVDRR